MVSRRNQPCPCGSNRKYKKCCGRLDQSDAARDCFTRGDAYFADREFGKAIESYREALDLNPLLAEAYYKTAHAYYCSQEPDRALQSLLNAMEIFPDNPLLFDSLVTLLNHHTPDFATDSPYVLASRALQDLHLQVSTETVIPDATVRKLYKQCLDILKRHAIHERCKTMQIYRGEYDSDNCERHKAIFERHNIIPEHCFDCYKVSLETRSVMDLIKLLLVFSDLDLPQKNHRKCMVEMRSGISGRYKGFIYCRGIAEAEEIRERLRPVVTRAISDDLQVEIKRGCSEFSPAFPEFDRLPENGVQPMTYPRQWRSREEDFDKDRTGPDQNPNNFTHDHRGFTLLDALVMHNWAIFSEEQGSPLLF